MKKSARPAASKASGDRGKAESLNTAATGKPGTKSSSSAPPLSKVGPDTRTTPSASHNLRVIRGTPLAPQNLPSALLGSSAFR